MLSGCGRHDLSSCSLDVVFVIVLSACGKHFVILLSACGRHLLLYSLDVLGVCIALSGCGKHLLPCSVHVVGICYCAFWVR